MSPSPRRTAATVAGCAAAVLLPGPSSSFVHPVLPTKTIASFPPPLQMSSVAADDYPALLRGAAACASSEQCSLDDARTYLREVVAAQSGCADGGDLAGSDVCADVLGASAVVADLRKKIDDGVERAAGTFWDLRHEELVSLASSVEGKGGALTAPMKPAYLAVAALYTVFVASALHPADIDAGGAVVPFTLQEVWWSLRDGYAGDLAAHFFHHGGLYAGESMAVTPTLDHLTAQEVMWSVRDGYVVEALSASGGYAEGSLPFTPEEAWWAVKEGYSMDMLEHWIRHSGLAV